MKVVIRELSKKQTLQQMLLALLEDVEKYFSSASAMSKQKTIATIQTLFSRVSKQFPLLAPIINISKKIIKDIEQEISQRTESKLTRRKTTGLRSFMQGIQGEKEGLERAPSEELQQSFQLWLKKVVIKCIENIKDDIKQADQLVGLSLVSRLARYHGNIPADLLFYDSFLQNEKSITGLRGYRIRKIVKENPKQNEITLQQSAMALRKARILVLSADAILKDGGLLVQSGGALLAVSAFQLGVPVVAVTRSYCLWQHFIQNQQPLILCQNGRKYFPDENQNEFRILIGKKYDYVQPKIVSAIIGQGHIWDSHNISEIFEDYYH